LDMAFVMLRFLRGFGSSVAASSVTLRFCDCMESKLPTFRRFDITRKSPIFSQTYRFCTSSKSEEMPSPSTSENRKDSKKLKTSGPRKRKKKNSLDSTVEDKKETKVAGSKKGSRKRSVKQGTESKRNAKSSSKKKGKAWTSSLEIEEKEEWKLSLFEHRFLKKENLENGIRGKIYVGNLPRGADKDEIEALFRAKNIHVFSVDLRADRFFAFVEIPFRDVERAASLLNTIEYRSRELNVRPAKDKPKDTATYGVDSFDCRAFLLGCGIDLKSATKYSLILEEEHIDEYSITRLDSQQLENWGFKFGDRVKIMDEITRLARLPTKGGFKSPENLENWEELSSEEKSNVQAKVVTNHQLIEEELLKLQYKEEELQHLNSEVEKMRKLSSMKSTDKLGVISHKDISFVNTSEELEVLLRNVAGEAEMKKRVILQPGRPFSQRRLETEDALLDFVHDLPIEFVEDQRRVTRTPQSHSHVPSRRSSRDPPIAVPTRDQSRDIDTEADAIFDKYALQAASETPAPLLNVQLSNTSSSSSSENINSNNSAKTTTIPTTTTNIGSNDIATLSSSSGESSSSTNTDDAEFERLLRQIRSDTLNEAEADI